MAGQEPLTIRGKKYREVATRIIINNIVATYNDCVRDKIEYLMGISHDLEMQK